MNQNEIVFVCRQLGTTSIVIVSLALSGVYMRMPALSKYERKLRLSSILMQLECVDFILKQQCARRWVKLNEIISMYYDCMFANESINSCQQ